MKRPRSLTLAAAVLSGCYLGSALGPDGSGPAGELPGGSGLEAGATLTGLPCEVASLLTTYCASCHGPSPTSGTSLVSYADLKKISKSNTSKSEAELALARMQDGTMPPQGAQAPSAQEIAVFTAWVNGGVQPGSCGGPGADAGPDPFAGPHVCSSNSYYSGGEGASMQPGNACISCHGSSFEAPRLTIAGTVYPTAHEPAKCKALGVAGAQVIITDHAGAKHTYSANSVGNFMGQDNIATPFTAVVSFNGKTRAMATPQANGDCNACHTENGASNAPGRVLLPN